MKTLFIILIVCLYPFSLPAVDLEKAVEMLEAAGDFETAEPVAFKLVQEKKEHYYRIEFLRKYPRSEFAEIVYIQTWKDVKDSGSIPKLMSFIKAAPGGPNSLEALDRLFNLYRNENTILGYQEYIRAFPNSPQAVDALQGIFRLAFERAGSLAEKENSVPFFDEYIRTFPTFSPCGRSQSESPRYGVKIHHPEPYSFSMGNMFLGRQPQKKTIARNSKEYQTESSALLKGSIF
ncbi:Uncharacterized protein dnl_25160 [Desulfonema limicola]|uniref:Uncharacterized protein n=1 Tax=Desulfonema limicola TaxID=45656 RepID=A0A975GGE0_9BACT|nr:hypothetical protein [Desulfonema limicola]QTA80220.1 Uncharacterized protein dnl_25160 [Desulfonema limicola]